MRHVSDLVASSFGFVRLFYFGACNNAQRQSNLASTSKTSVNQKVKAITLQAKKHVFNNPVSHN